MRISTEKSIFLGRTTTYNNKEDDKKYEWNEETQTWDEITTEE